MSLDAYCGPVDPFRDELSAAHQRIEQLEKELAEARGVEKKKPQPPKEPHPARQGSRVLARMAFAAAAGTVGATMYYGCSLLWQGNWEGHSAILADVTGDGVADVIGRIRHQEMDNSVDRVTIAASDGKTGKRLWESESLGTYMESYQGPIGLAGNTLLFASPAAELRAFGARDGKSRWRSRLSEHVKAFCRGSDANQAILRMADDRRVSVDLASGHTNELPSDPKLICEALPDDQTESGSFSLRTGEARTGLTGCR